MSFEITGKEFDRAFDRRTRHGDQIAKSFAFVEGQNFAELFENRLAALALLHFLHHHRQGAGFHAAGGALTAGFSGEKFGDPENLFNDTGSLADQTNNAAAKAGAGVAHGVVIERRVDFLRR